jgi:predicted DNA-binding protein with PD1-like motif
MINDAPERTIVLVFETGDEVVSTFERYAVSQHLKASRLTAIGAFEKATLGYFDWHRKAYEHVEVAEQVEVLSLVGDVALDGDKPKLHAHVVLGRRGGATIGGHLLAATVRPTLEVVLVDAPAYLQRRFDPGSGIALIRPER